jgi:hypothetical protein
MSVVGAPGSDVLLVGADELEGDAATGDVVLAAGGVVPDEFAVAVVGGAGPGEPFTEF